MFAFVYALACATVASAPRQDKWLSSNGNMDNNAVIPNITIAAKVLVSEPN